LSNRLNTHIGSTTLEMCRSDSDIDLAILLKPEKVTEEQAEIETETILQELPPVQNHPYDLIILNRVSAVNLVILPDHFSFPHWHSNCIFFR